MDRRYFLKNSVATWAGSALPFAMRGLAAINEGTHSGDHTQLPGKASVTHPYPEGDKGDLWLLGGQSNMNGNGRLLEEIAPDPRILFYSHTNEWMIAKDPLSEMFFPTNSSQGKPPDYTHLPVGGSGLGPFFAKHVLQATNRPIGLIGVQWGKPMTMVWDPNLMNKGEMPPPPYLYDRIIQRVIEAGGYGKLKGMVWYQGESDAVEYPSASKVFERNLLNFIDGVRRDTGNAELPIIIVQICRLVTDKVPGVPGKSGGGEAYKDLFGTITQAWEHVREVQRQMPYKRDKVYVVGTVDLYPLVDPIHLDFGAFKRLGRRIAEVALSEIYGLPGHGTPIQLESVQAGPLRSYKTGQGVHGHSEIRVRFKGLSGKLQAAGRPSGFSVVYPGPTGSCGLERHAPIYATEIDSKDPATVLLRLTGDLHSRTTTQESVPPSTSNSGHLEKTKSVLYYGAGLNPYCNLVDEKDIAVPAFGPVSLGV
jgi:sialate O-acetylesterase